MKLYLYYLKRVLLYILIFFLALTTFFFILRLAPGDPVLRYVQQMESRYGTSGASEVGDLMAKEFRAQFGLDKPIFQQYLSFVYQLVFRGNFGPSMVAYPAQAQEMIFNALPWSIALLSVAILIAFLFGMVLGTVLGWRRGKALDIVAAPFALVFSQVPVYLMSLLLSMALVYGVRLFPASGAYAASVTKAFSLPFLGSVAYHAMLPALSMVAVYTFGWSLTQRALVINLIGEDYMRLAEAKGLPDSRLINRYVLRNTLLPQATGLALSLGFAVNGFFLIEWIFRYPGIGRLFVLSIRSLDYNVLLGITVISMLVVLVANLIMEFLYPLIDPRIRRG